MRAWTTRRTCTCFLLAWTLVAAGGNAASAPPLLELDEVAAGLDLPLGLAHAGDGSGRLFVLEQRGRVRILAGGELRTTPFLDLSSRVSCCGERGLLGLAFHPDYAGNGLFFVNYTVPNGDTVVSRFSVSADPDRADPDSETEILRFGQPFGNHNGGHLAFGPDGMLYVATGDGGSGGDPQDNGQRLDTLLGKILRIDVDASAPYAVPADNPFAAQAGARGEVWAYGLRNPWRFSFDRATGDLLMGDVGQGRFEEINHQEAASPGGENYGWRLFEGNACFEPPVGCDGAGLTAPVIAYSHAEGCSVTGGYRYRGLQTTTLPRFYVYGDFCSGTIWGGRPNTAGRWRSRPLLESGLAISSFGEDEAGEVYVIDYGGRVYRLVGLALLAADFEDGTLGAFDQARGGVEAVAPGLGGSAFALGVPVEGSDRKSFVRTNRPAREEGLEICFRLSADRVDLGETEVEILQLLGRRPHLRLRLEPRGRRYRVTLWAAGAAGELELVGGTGLPAARAVPLCVEWSRASAAGAADGEAVLSKRGRVRARATGLDNPREFVRAVRIGLPRGSEGAPGGAFRIDDLVITP